MGSRAEKTAGQPMATPHLNNGQKRNSLVPVQNCVIQQAKLPTYTNAQITASFPGGQALNVNEPGDGDVNLDSDWIHLDGSVDITRGTIAGENVGVEIGFVQTLLDSSITAKYSPHAGKEERCRLRLSPQPCRDGDPRAIPWYGRETVKAWNGVNVVGFQSKTLKDAPCTYFPLQGKIDNQPIYAVEGYDRFKSWLIAWKDRKAKYLAWQTWEVDYGATKAAGVWTATGSIFTQANGQGAGRNPANAVLGDPVANNCLKEDWRKT